VKTTVLGAVLVVDSGVTAVVVAAAAVVVCVAAVVDTDFVVTGTVVPGRPGVFAGSVEAVVDVEGTVLVRAVVVVVVVLVVTGSPAASSDEAAPADARKATATREKARRSTSGHGSNRS
jgi:hypothetical protein